MTLAVKELYRRLGFVKYMFQHARQQSYQTNALEAALSILTFHDSVEAFLQLAMEHHRSPVSRGPDFLQYWTVPQEAGCTLTPPGPLRRFNDVRVGLKHRGIIPSPQEIESARVNVADFFQDNTPKAFAGVEFDSISLIDLVEDPAVQERLRHAERDLTAGKAWDVLEHVAVAFEQLMRRYEAEMRESVGSKSFHAGRGYASMGFRALAELSLVGLEGDEAEPEEVQRKLIQLVFSVRGLEAALQLTSVGIDYRRHWKFRALTPAVAYGKDGPFSDFVEREKEGPASLEEARYCFEFALDAALRLQGFRGQAI